MGPEEKHEDVRSVRGARGRDHRREVEGMETVRIDFDARYPPFETTTAHSQLVGFDTDLTGQAPRA
jgi:hypothetical protein